MKWIWRLNLELMWNTKHGNTVNVFTLHSIGHFHHYNRKVFVECGNDILFTRNLIEQHIVLSFFFLSEAYRFHIFWRGDLARRPDFQFWTALQCQLYMLCTHPSWSHQVYSGEKTTTHTQEIFEEGKYIKRFGKLLDTLSALRFIV